MKNEPIKHDQVFPPAASAGGDNAYYLKGCDVAQRSPAYASCLYKISENAAGRSHEIYRDCNAAIDSRQCQALGLKQEEQLAGQAMYYFPRKPPQAITLPLSAAGDFGVRITNLTPPALIPKDTKPKGRFKETVTKSDPKPAVSALDRELAMTDGYATAINAAMTEPTEQDFEDAFDIPVGVPMMRPADIEAAMKKIDELAEPKPATPPPAPQNAPTARPAMQAGESPLQYARRIAATR